LRLENVLCPNDVECLIRRRLNTTPDSESLQVYPIHN